MIVFSTRIFVAYGMVQLPFELNVINDLWHPFPQIHTLHYEVSHVVEFEFRILTHKLTNTMIRK